jgi:hypothetical protein
MKYVRFALGSSLVLALLATASLAGTATRTWVSRNGNDSNECTLTAPCRNFNAAIAQTASGGEVVAMDSACYQPFSISQAVTVEAAPGVYVGISVSSGDGIDVYAGAQDAVTLRGLSIKNQGSTSNGTAYSDNGILYYSGGTLDVEDCTVDGFAQGLYCPGTGAQLVVTDSVFTANAWQIAISGTSSPISAIINGVRLESSGPGNGGLLVLSGSNVVIKNSTITGCSAGVAAWANSSQPVNADVDNCVIFDNSGGISAYGTASGIVTVRVSNSMVTDNFIGLNNTMTSPSTILTRTNNTVEGNNTDEAGTVTTYLAK